MVHSAFGLHHRAAITIAEALVTTVVVTAVLSMLVPLLFQLRQSRQRVHERQVARLEAANVMERFSALAQQGPPSQAELDRIEPSAMAVAWLPDLEVSISTDSAVDSASPGNDEDRPHEGRYVSVLLTWEVTPTRPPARFALSSWFPMAEEQEE